MQFIAAKLILSWRYRTLALYLSLCHSI